MKHKLIKQKALFQILLVISLSFYTSLSFAALNSQPNNIIKDKTNKVSYFDLIKQDLLPNVNAASKVCCEITANTSIYKGSSCVFTEESNCAQDSQKLSVSCLQTDYCAAGVCKLSGTCQDNVEKGICLDKGGTWNKGKSADDPQCKVGCCDLPSGASITTQAQCSDKVKQFPDVSLGDIFKSDIQDQTQCLQQSRSNEEGCCVISSQNQCKFGTRKECNDISGDFQLNALCSKPGLNCQVTAKHSTMCYQNKVYWQDSAGNRENVYDGKFDSNWEYTNWLSIDPGTIAKLNPQTLAEISGSGNCQFSLGSTCGKVTDGVKDYLANTKNLQPNDVNKIKNQCISLDCVNTKKNSNIAWMDGRTRQNGESWCEYQSKTGDGEDLVGSSQILHICDNGIERVEVCSERREKICVQNDAPGSLIDPTNPNQKNLTFASCVPNNWQLCLAANSDNENCGVSDPNAQYDSMYDFNNGPCSGYKDEVGNIREDQQGNYDSCIMKTICRKKTCEEQALGNCYFNTGVGLCAPAVPIGSLGKESNFEKLTNGQKLGFSFDAQMSLVETSAFGGDPEFGEDCKEGCNIYTSDFANKWNNYCTSLGDVGAKYNVVGYYSKDGLYHGGAFGGDVNNIENAQGVTQPSYANLINNIKPLSGNLYALISATSNLKVINFEQLKDFDFKSAFYENINNWIASIGIIISPVILYSLLVLAFIPELGLTAFSAVFSTVIGYAAGVSVFGVPGLILAAVIIIFAFLSSLFSYSSNLTYKISCGPWTPPDKGESCKLCNDRSKFPNCNEYLCQSLGKACKLLNDGSPGNETCVSQVGSTTPPIIAPLILVPFKEQDIQKVPPSTGYTGGYRFIKNITAFTSVEVGIKIIDSNDPNKEDFAECKVSRFNDFKYEDTTSQFLEDSLTKAQHIRRLEVSQSPILPQEDRIELESGKVNTFYIKCKSPRGVINIKPYFIEIPVTKGPDTAPPEIKSFSIKNNAFIPYNLQKTNLVMYVEDQSGLENRTTNQTNGLDGGCRYSTIKDQDYTLMPYEMICGKTRINVNQYACTTKLNLKPNQENVFYFKCRDTVGNTNPVDSPPVEGDSTDGYHLLGSQPLTISILGPSQNILTTDVNLTLTTQAGAEDGKAACYYAGGEKLSIKNLGDLTFSPSGIKFATTDSSNHETKLSLLNEKDYLFYLWCRDIAGNEDNTTVQFHTTTPDLNITNALPNNKKIYSDNIQLQVTTVGGTRGNGDSDCTYASIGTNNAGSGNINDYKTKLQLETNHYKNITLSDGSYQLEIKCIDNVIYKSDKQVINFEVDVSGIPKLIRIFKQANLLNIITDRQSECHYSPTDSKFIYEEANLKMVTTNNLQHQLDMANSKVFYIKCQDLNTKQISPTYTIYV